MQGEVWPSQEAQQDVLQTSSFLLSFFQCVCSMGQEHPCLVQTLAVCIGDYAAWFGRCPLPFTLYIATPERVRCDGCDRAVYITAFLLVLQLLNPLSKVIL